LLLSFEAGPTVVVETTTAAELLKCVCSLSSVLFEKGEKERIIIMPVVKK
jgi:hypothetical protein